MKTAVRYFSRGGNTKKVAEAIAQGVGVQAEPVSVPLSEHVDKLFLCNSVYAAGIDGAVKDFVEQNKGQIGTLYNVSTAALLQSSYKQMQKLCAQHGVHLATEEYHCRGSFGALHKGHPDQDDLTAATAFAKKLI